MNNNNNFKNRRSRPEPGDARPDDISTKKGFLISLPGRKKKAEHESTINLSAPQKGHDSITIDQPSGAKPFADKTQKNGGERRDNNRRPQKQNNRPKRDDVSKTENVKAPSQAQAKAVGTDDKAKQTSQTPNRLIPNNNRRPRNDRPKNAGDRPQNSSQKGPVPQNNQNAAPKDSSGDRNQRPKGDFEKRGGSNDRRRNNDRRPKSDKPAGTGNNAPANGNAPVVFRKNENKKPVPKSPMRSPLSALSGELADFTAHKNEIESGDAVKSRIKEPSLEEKYKDAVPLAEQIAAEQTRAKGSKAAFDEAEKQEIVGVRFREAGKVYYFDPDGQALAYGTPVVVETARGSEYGIIAIANRMIPSSSIVAPLKKLERVATEADTQKYLANKQLEKQGEEVFREKVAKLGLEMNLIYVEYTFDNSKLLFYFTAETRIDFRELLKELAGVFRTRIELRQIGVRDEAKVLGGLGVCGRATCCSSFLSDFAQVSIKMAKDQNLSLNAAKISGACGKLMCCLRYEDKAYEDANSKTPKLGAIVETPDGKGTVIERNPLKATVKVILEAAPDVPSKLYASDSLIVTGFEKVQTEHIDENADEIKDEE